MDMALNNLQWLIYHKTKQIVIVNSMAFHLVQSFSKVFMRFKQVFSGIFLYSLMVTHSNSGRFLLSDNLFELSIPAIDFQ